VNLSPGRSRQARNYYLAAPGARFFDGVLLKRDYRFLAVLVGIMFLLSAL
jgi:hypothetical protein